MRLWRISAYAGLTGDGGTYVDGRWHNKPKQVLYTAEHPALSMAEVMAHMRLNTGKMPLTLKLISIDVKRGARFSPTPLLPDGWQANQVTSQAVGDQWLESGKGLLMKVPSAILPHSFNYLINAQHPQANTHLTEIIHGPFWLDSRFVGK